MNPATMIFVIPPISPALSLSLSVLYHVQSTPRPSLFSMTTTGSRPLTCRRWTAHQIGQPKQVYVSRFITEGSGDDNAVREAWQEREAGSVGDAILTQPAAAAVNKEERVASDDDA